MVSVSTYRTTVSVTVRGYHFGGVGESGMGAYGGAEGFINFSHAKPVLIKDQGFEWLFK